MFTGSLFLLFLTNTLNVSVDLVTYLSKLVQKKILKFSIVKLQMNNIQPKCIASANMLQQQ